MEQEASNTCSYIIPRKNRRCRMMTKRGQTYCGEHSAVDPGNEKRIPCPLDKKHTVDASQLEAHLLVCNSRLRDDSQNFLNRNVNAVNGEVKADEKLDAKITCDIVHASGIMDNIQQCYENVNIISNNQRNQEPQSAIDRYLAKDGETLGTETVRELNQLNAIIGKMGDLGMVDNSESSCVLDLGAGRGRLCYWMSQEWTRPLYLLVDRAGVRNKMENRALRESKQLRMLRIRASIEHIDLSKLEVLKGITSITIVTKHLCGSASDAAMRCILNAISAGLCIKNIAFIPCCHHKSRYQEYTGGNYLREFKMGDENDFAQLRYIASWATCGFDKKQSSEDRQISNGDKVKFGRMAKAILETGRMKALDNILRQISNSAHDIMITEYVSEEVTPENYMICARVQNVV